MSIELKHWVGRLVIRGNWAGMLLPVKQLKYFDFQKYVKKIYAIVLSGYFSFCYKYGPKYCLVSFDKASVIHNRLVDPSFQFSSVQFSRSACPTLCDPMDCSTPGRPVHHQLLELAQTHVHWVGDAIQSSHPLSSPSPPTFNLSQHQGFFQWVSFLNQVAKYWTFSFSIFRTDFL